MQWILLQERERVAAGGSSATEMRIPSWIALTDPSTTSMATKMAPSIDPLILRAQAEDDLGNAFTLGGLHGISEDGRWELRGGTRAQSGPG